MIDGVKYITENENLKLCIKDNDIYINIPSQILNKGERIILAYIRICTQIEKLKENINKYLFDKSASVSPTKILEQLVKIKEDEAINDVSEYLDFNIDEVEEKLKTMCVFFGINKEEIENKRQELINNYIDSSEGIENIIDKDYVNEVLRHINENQMYSLKAKSRYGAISSEYNLKNKEDILDTNEKEINGQYSPILVIHRPAKYHRGEYTLENTSNIYIKRQPLEALIKQERLEERGIDSMGAIIYKKLNHDLSNENLQELLAEIYVYAKKNDISYENIKLADITSNKVWMTADKLKKEFKELRYYHKNLTQKVKEIYDSTDSYYTQIGGKYIFNSRELVHSYKTYKGKDIN